MEFRRWAAISFSVVLALPLSATASTRSPSEREFVHANDRLPASPATRMPAPTTAEPHPTEATLPVACAPGDSNQRRIGKVPRSGATRWVDPNTLEIGTGAAATHIRVNSSKLGPLQAVKSGTFTANVNPPDGDIVNKDVTIVDNRTHSTRNWHGVFFDIAPDRPVMLVASTRPGRSSDFDELSLASGKIVSTYTGFSTAGPTWTARYSTGGRWIAVVSRVQVHVFDTRSKRLTNVTRFEQPGSPNVVFSNNDRWLLLGTVEFGTTVLDLGSGAIVKLPKLIASFTNGDGRYVAGSISDYGDVVVPGSCESKVYNLRGALIRSISPSGNVSPSGEYVAVPETNGTALYRTR